MFGFLNSLALPFLAAAAIPLLIYLFRRQKAKHISFSSIRFLKILENRHIRNLRIYQILLLLVRIAFIIFLVLAFARPVLRVINITGSSAARATAVIVVDDSYSMKTYAGAKTRFETALDALNKIMASFDETDQVYILSTKESGSKIRVQSTPANLSAGNHILPLDKLLNEAVSIFNQRPNLNKEFYLLTDGKINRHALTDSLPSALLDAEIHSYIMQPSAEQTFANVSIDTVVLLTGFFEMNRPIVFEVHLTNHNTQAPVTAHLNLFNDNKRMAMAQAQLPAGESEKIQIRYSPRKNGRQIIHFELDDDDLQVDNYYYINFQIPERIKILFVDQPQKGLVNAAVQTFAESAVLNIDKATYSTWQGRQFRNYDLIVLNDPQPFQAQTTSRIDEYLKQNKNLLIIPGSRMTPIQLNSLFKTWAGRDVFGELVKAPGADQYFLLENEFYRNAIFSAAFSRKDRQIEAPKVYQYFKIIRPDNIIISLTNNDPFLVQIQKQIKQTSRKDAFRQKTGLLNGQGKIYLFSSGLEPAWTNFPFQGFFVPMLYRIFYSAGYSSDHFSSYTIGESVRLSPSSTSSDINYQLKPPRADRYPLNVMAASGGPQLFIGNLNNSGHYLLYANDKLENAFSVNLSAKELTTPFINLSMVLPKAEIIPMENIKSIDLKKARVGQELWLLFLLLAIAMLLLEIWLIKIIEQSGKG